jgi:hypothetical protein
MHYGEAQGDTMDLRTHAVLLVVQSSVDSFALRTLAKAELGSTMGSDLVYSILSPEWNADRRYRQGSLLDCSRTPVPGDRFVQVGVYGGWIYGAGIPVTTY